MSDAIERPQHWDNWISRESVKMIEALPLSVPDADMKRAHARLRLALSSLPDDSDVYACTPNSVIGCMAMSAMTGLMPGGHNPDVWLIPRKSKKHGYRLVLNWQISYRGHVRLCRRNPGWDVQAVPVYAPDLFDRSRSSAGGAEYRHEPVYDSTEDPEADWQELRGCLILVRSPIAGKWDFLSKGAIQKRRSLARDQSNWQKWPIERAMGTACAYAGQREMWPTDDPTRYALSMEAAQVGAICGTANAVTSLLPTDGLRGAKSKGVKELGQVQSEYEIADGDAERLAQMKEGIHAEEAAGQEETTA